MSSRKPRLGDTVVFQDGKGWGSCRRRGVVVTTPERSVVGQWTMRVAGFDCLFSADTVEVA